MAGVRPGHFSSAWDVWRKVATRRNFENFKIPDVGYRFSGSSSVRFIKGEPIMSKISPCLWFNGEAEEAAKFYVSLLPDSRIDRVQRSPVDNPGGKAGTVLVVSFTLAGQEYMALNGGTRVEYTHAISFKIDCADQAEVDRLWDALSSNGGETLQCGWVRDRYGVSWQIVPTVMLQWLGGPDPAGAKRAMQAMMSMTKLNIAELRRAYEGKSAA
jgi:predicted 3-demethylubiquinone-9 3-methyltransferase (glyoxalase superfamily)